MAEINTHADSLRVYHTGAASPGAAQATPNSSLGGWHSSSEVQSLQAVVTNAISNVTVAFLAGENGTGTGYLYANTTDTLQWKAPGSSTYGTAVTIANGETKVLEDGENASAFVRVSRTSASNLTGTATLTLTHVLNNAVGLDDVSSTESAAGDTEYRTLALKNGNASAVQNLAVWIDPLIATSATSDTAQLSATGAGTVGSSASLSLWDASGHAAIFASGGSLKEVVYYSARTANALTIPTAGRGRLGSSATAGAATDFVKPVPPIAIGIQDADEVGTPVFTGSGLNDLTAGGTVSAYVPRQYRVQIDGAGHPDTFKWSNDNGGTWEATTVAITSATQTLENGIEIVLSATTGHTATDRWDFTVGKAAISASEGAAPSGITFSTPYASTGALTPNNLATDEVAYVHIKRDVVAGAVAKTQSVVQIARSFDAG